MVILVSVKNARIYLLKLMFVLHKREGLGNIHNFSVSCPFDIHLIRWHS